MIELRVLRSGDPFFVLEPFHWPLPEKVVLQAPLQFMLIWIPSDPHDLFHPADEATLQAYLYTVGMMRRFGENIPDDTFSKRTGSLILFLDDLHSHTYCNPGSVFPYMVNHLSPSFGI